MRLRHPLLYDAEQVAALWQMHPGSIYRANLRGELPVLALRVGRHLRWPRGPVNASVGLAPDADPFVDAPASA